MWPLIVFKGFKSKGVHMVILNILRVCNIIGLISVMIASWALAIKINQDKPFFVFDAASLVFMSMIATFLLCSELPFGHKFFANMWPVFGPNKGLFWLGLSLIIIGCNVLGKLNNENNESEDLSTPWYSLTLASGIMNLVFGVLNIFFGLLLGSGSQNARQVRHFGSSPDTSSDLPQYDSSSSIHTEKKGEKGPFWLRFPKAVARKAVGGGLMRRNCENTPPPRPSSPHHEAYDLERNTVTSDDDRLNHRNEALGRLSGHDQDTTCPPNGSKPLTSPIAPNVMRPDSQQHPAFKFNVPRPPSSVYDGPRRQHYSTASNLTQFPHGPYDRV